MLLWLAGRCRCIGTPARNHREEDGRVGRARLQTCGGGSQCDDANLTINRNVYISVYHEGYHLEPKRLPM